MLTLMKKNAYFYGIYLLGLLPLMAIWSFTSSGELGFIKIMFQGQWTIILVIGCVGVSEVVAAKFGVLFLAVKAKVTHVE